MDHSKLPWKAGSGKVYHGDDNPICKMYQNTIVNKPVTPDAAFIVQACNAYYENKRKADAYEGLVEMLTAYVADMQYDKDEDGIYNGNLKKAEALLEELGEL